MTVVSKLKVGSRGNGFAYSLMFFINFSLIALTDLFISLHNLCENQVIAIPFHTLLMACLTLGKKKKKIEEKVWESF